MADINAQTVDTGMYEREKGMYVKVLIALLILTAITFAQPFVFFKSITFEAQILIAFAKAWIIVAYYMHLKNEKRVLGLMVAFSLMLVLFFFFVTMIDVSNFQFADESYITSATKE